MTTSVFSAGEPVALVVSIPSLSGPITGVSVTIYDEADVVISGPVTSTPNLVGVTLFQLSVSALHNTLTAGQTSGARRAVVAFTDGAQTKKVSENYLLTSPVQLVMLENSFVTYGMALMTRHDLPSLVGWDGAEESARIAALKVAHASMLNLRYRFQPTPGSEYSRITDFPDLEAAYYSSTGSVFVGNLFGVTQEEWQDFPARFKQALARAQVTEANSLLDDNSIASKRRLGIVSETIGESSMFMRQSPEVRMAVCNEAMAHLSGMTVRRNILGRGS